MTTSTSAPAPTRFTARTPEDVLALVPVVLGFVPEASVVMLTFGARHPFHARVDLPPADAPPDHLAALVQALLAPAVHHGVRRAVLVVYTPDRAWADRVLAALARALEEADIEVPEALRADAGRWWPLLGGRGLPDHVLEEGVPYDVGTHRFAAEAVAAGMITRGSRTELADSLRPDPDRVAAVEAALRLVPSPPGTPFGLLPPHAWLRAEGAWVRGLVAEAAASGRPTTPEETARLLRGLTQVRVRDAAWSLLSRAVASDHVALWTGVVRSTPPSRAAPAACLLGFAAWQAGEGALAWCAADVAERAEPGYRLTGLLAEALARAVPPDTWTSDWRWDEGLDGPEG